MRITRLFVILVVFSLLARASPHHNIHFVKVRDSKLPTNLRIRLLLDRIDLKSDRQISLSGFHLMDNTGKRLPAENLICSSKMTTQTLGRKKSALKTKSQARPSAEQKSSEKPQWFCKAGKSYSFPLKDGVSIFPEGGFIEYQSKSYRGGIEFAVLESQIQVINMVDLETYLVGLLTKEMSPEFPAEALKAQAVAARSYALARAADQRNAGKRWDVMVTQSDQVYEGAHTEDPRTLAAVRATAGEALFFRDEVVTAYYHASSGGYLEVPENLWGKSNRLADRLTYAVSDNPWDKNALEWESAITSDLGEMWSDVGRIEGMSIVSKTSGRRVEVMRVAGERGVVLLSGAEVRRRFGQDIIRSLNFDVETLSGGKGWKIKGRGWGHGVGLSQWAAKAMAENSLSYLAILKFHYPFADVRNWIPKKAARPLPQELPPIPKALVR